MISNQTRDLIYHLMDLRNHVHESDRELLADVLARVQGIHVALTSLEHDLAGFWDVLTAEDATEAAKRTGA